MPTFDQKIEKMKQIFRGEETYGEGKPADQAMRYRNEEMFDEIIERARANSGFTDERVDFLISLSGFSPATTILAFEILQPERLLVINSADARRSIDIIGDHILGSNEGKLNYSDFFQEDCDPSDPLSIYEIIKRRLEKLNRSGAQHVNAYLDITGGKKVMSATAALAAWQLDLPLIYIDSQFDPELRKPIPGTERALKLDNPTALFGEQELKTATSIFDSGGFEAAATRFDSLAKRLANPTQARFMRKLSQMYQAWCDMNFEALSEYAGKVVKELQNAHLQLDNQKTRRLEKQTVFLQKLAPESRNEMLLSYFLLGLHYQRQGRHDFATLLFYRTIEGCFDVHLASTYAGFDTNEPDYSKLPGDQGDLVEAYDSLALDVWGESGRTGLPGKIGFMNAALLLAAVEDGLLEKVGMNSVRGLKRLQKIGAIRNQSVLAHGFERITEEQSQTLNKIAENIFEHFWGFHGDGTSLEETYAPLQFVKMSRNEPRDDKSPNKNHTH